MQSNLLERMRAKNLQNSVEFSGRFERLVQNRYEQIGRHCDPDSRFHSKWTRSEILLDAKVYLDPFEKKLDVPTPQSRCFVNRARLLPCKPQIVFGAGNGKCVRCGAPVEGREVGLALLKKVNGAWFEHQCLQPVHVVQTAGENKDTNRYWSPQIDLHLNLDAPLGVREVAHGTKVIDKLIVLESKA